MTNVSEWSVTAGLNNSSPPNGWPEGMARSAVNDCAREMMAALAKWYQDSNGTLVTAGTGNAYTLTTNSVYTALNDIPLLVFRADRANTGAATLTVDSLTAKAIVKAGSGDPVSSGEIAINQLLIVSYNSTLDKFQIVGPEVSNSFSSGTTMVFAQTSAPTGWTKGSTHNDKALRLTTGTASSGGSTAFSSVLTARSIATGNLPSHSHGAGGYVVGTGITFTNPSGATSCVSSGGSGASGWTSGGSGGSISLAANLSSGGVVGSSGLTGSGTAMDFAVQYVDVILASKD